jgi:polyisoprenoid-binding protein YceI
LGPQTTTIDLTIYAMGLFPMPAHFLRFAGTLRVDPQHPADCIVVLDIAADSLIMDDKLRARLAMGPQLLDAAHYPSLHYQGSCAGGQPHGTLTMHGVSHALTLTARQQGDQVAAQGSLRRQDYNVSGLPGVIGRTIGFQFSMRLPQTLAAAVSK